MIKGLHIVSKKRPGKPVRWYVYAWRGGPCIKTVVGGPRPSLTAADVEALSAAQLAKRARQGTFARLLDDWRDSPEWRGMAKSTRAEWGRITGMFKPSWYQLPLAVFDDRRTRDPILKWRDDNFANTPRQADYVIQVLRAALAWGRDRGRLSNNILDDVSKLYSGGQRAEIIWEPAEIERWQQARQSCRDAVNLAALTGLRRGDLVEVPWAAVGDHALVWRTSKGGVRATIPLYPKLRALLNELRTRPRREGVDTILVSALGTARSGPGLTADFIEERKRLKLPPKRLHDFRGTFATEIMMPPLSFTDRQVADIIGWSEGSVAKIRKLYVDQARVVVGLAEAMAKAAL